MKIVFLEWTSYGRADLKAAFAAEGHEVLCIPFDMSIGVERLHNDPELEDALSKTIQSETPDVVFQINYFPVVSKVCNKEKIKYISWVYDNPFVMLYSTTVVNPCNTIYVFDKAIYLQFYSAGITTVHYMPLAANTERLDGMADVPGSDYDISFVGSLYLETKDYYSRMEASLSDYAKGYLDGLIAAQLKIYGYNFIEQVLGPVMKDLYMALPMEIQPNGIESLEYLYAQYVINKRIATIERMELLETIAQSHKVDLFTHYGGFTLPNLCNHGPVDYDSEMPRVFRCSKINLNISRRGVSGIPLRAFDIMGAGGFLLSNYQADFLDLFIPGRDFVYYESKEDLLRKIDYYLEHEDERIEIAKNGHDKIASAHTYRIRVKEMLDF